MSRNYKFNNPDGTYFISFATVEWVDVFTRRKYRDILMDSLKYCQKEKGLILYAYVIMSNHIHLIAKSKVSGTLPDILRDFKKFTAKAILKAIRDNPKESRKEWMVNIFSDAGINNGNNKNFQFWRQDNRPIHVYSESVIKQKLNYIHQNPVKEGIVLFAKDYQYSSASVYAGLTGLLNVYILD